MSHHLKRLAAPRSWLVPRKTNVYTTKPSPGPHAIAHAVPLATVLRDYLGLAATGREARTAIGAGDILVDGRVVKNSKLPVGFQDVVSVPKLKKAWRCVIDDKARMRFVAVGGKDAAWKLVRVQNKTTVKGGKTQLNLHDGRNLLVKKDDYKTGDVLKLEVPSQTVIGHFPLKEGAEVLVTGGRHAGEIAPIRNLEATRSHKANLVHLADGEGTFTTVHRYAFPIGEKDNLPKAEVKVLG
ncbi:MAG: 30S ribosomal protein S4e [Thermoplasmatota archaeon]